MSGYVRLGEVRTYYEEDGNGEPLVLPHPGGADSRAWELSLPGFAERFRVFRPDRRGHGRTPDIEGPITYEQMALDTIAFLEQVVGGPVSPTDPTTFPSSPASCTGCIPKSPPSPSPTSRPTRARASSWSATTTTRSTWLIPLRCVRDCRNRSSLSCPARATDCLPTPELCTRLVVEFLTEDPHGGDR